MEKEIIVYCKNKKEVRKTLVYLFQHGFCWWYKKDGWKGGKDFPDMFFDESPFYNIYVNLSDKTLAADWSSFKYENAITLEEFKKIKKGRYSIENKFTNKIIMKITNLVKKLLDKKTRDLIEAGYIDGDLELTEEGKEALLSILFIEKKEELVKMAQDEIKNNK